MVLKDSKVPCLCLICGNNTCVTSILSFWILWTRMRVSASHRIAWRRVILHTCKGLILTTHNNADMKSIFKLCHEANFVRGQPITSFHVFRATVGQFTRFSVVCGNLTAEDVCVSCSVFDCITHLKTIHVFTSYFQLRCASSTVLSKVFHLGGLAGHAITYFTSYEDAHHAKLAQKSRYYLRSVCAAEKMETRTGTARMRVDEARIAVQRYVTGNDFLEYAGIARNALQWIMDSAIVVCQSTGNSQIEYMASRRVLISKWCINFLGMLMFAGSGQRPQVYASLAIPEYFDLTNVEWTGGSCPKFAAGIEKTCRASGFSSVVFTRWTHKIFHFHIRVVHQAVLRSRYAAASSFRPCSSEGANGSENSAARTFSMPNTLLIYTQTCEPYTTANV
jgi:hypothetical protein